MPVCVTVGLSLFLFPQPAISSARGLPHWPCVSRRTADGMVRVNENSAEHLHVDVAVEHLDQSVIRLPGVGFEEHQRDFPLWRKHRGIALRMLFRKCRCELFCYLLQGKHGMEATEFTRFKALAIFLHQIEFCERKNRADLDNFL